MNKVEKKMIAYIEWHSRLYINGAHEKLGRYDTPTEEINDFVRDMRTQENGMIDMLETFLMEKFDTFDKYQKSKDYKEVEALRDRLTKTMLDNIKY